MVFKEGRLQRRDVSQHAGVMQVNEPTTEVVKTGLTMASCMNHIKNNRIEYLIVSLLMYSVGALDKAIEYGTGICV